MTDTRHNDDDQEESIGLSAIHNFDYGLDQFKAAMKELIASPACDDRQLRVRLRHHAKRVTISAGTRGVSIECDTELFFALVPEGFPVTVTTKSHEYRVLSCSLPGGGLKINTHQFVKRTLVDGAVVEVWS